MIELERNDSPDVLLARVREVLPTPWEWHMGGAGFYQSVTSRVASDRQIAPVFVLAISFLLLIAGIFFVAARSVNRQRRPELEAWLRDVMEAKGAV